MERGGTEDGYRRTISNQLFLWETKKAQTGPGVMSWLFGVDRNVSSAKSATSLSHFVTTGVPTLDPLCPTFLRQKYFETAAG